MIGSLGGFLYFSLFFCNSITNVGVMILRHYMDFENVTITNVGAVILSSGNTLCGF
jgi:hypothetical protein